MQNIHRHLLLPVLMLPALLGLLNACAHSSPPSSLPPGVKPAKVQPLPAQARVSKVPTPSICSPTCSAGQTARRESSLSTLTPSAPPGSAASAPTTPSR